MSVFLVFTTVPNRTIAQKMVRQILAKHLAACAHMTPPGESHYWWKGSLQKAREVAITFKTAKKALPSLLRTLKDIHPYETPEILAVRADYGNPAYLEWVKQETHP